ncbi:MAG: hypothetical protein ACYC9O_06825 [Candidatus Latescibacterota bacterium]
MSGKLHIQSLPLLFVRIALAGVFAVPLMGVDQAEGGVNLVGARVQVVTQNRSSRTSVEIETANYGSSRDYYPSRGYGSSGCGGSGRGYGNSSRYYSSRMAAKRYWEEERRPRRRSSCGRSAPRVYRQVETYSREEYDSYGSQRGGTCSHGDYDSRRMGSRSRVSDNYRDRRR